MGPWSQEYERNWRAFTTQVLTDRFGAQQSDALPITQDDKAYLETLLKSMGVQHHASPKKPTLAFRKSGSTTTPRTRRRKRMTTTTTTGAPSHSETQLFDDMVDGDEEDEESYYHYDAEVNGSTMSDASYVYWTPQKQKRASLGQYFPEFSSQDFMADGNTSRESASQNLRIRMADVSPIARSSYAAATRQQERSNTKNSNTSRRETDRSPLTDPHTGSPSPLSQSASTSASVADLPPDDAAFSTPRPFHHRHQRQHAGSAIQERLGSHEKSIHESRVHDLDVSMQSMNLSDDGFMILDNPKEHSDDADGVSERERDAQGSSSDSDEEERHEERDIPKVLYFSSDSEDEDMDYEFGVDIPYDSSAEEMDQDGGGDAHSDDQRVVKAEPDTRDAMEVVRADAGGKAPTELIVVDAENNANSVNASSQSVDSFDAKQGVMASCGRPDVWLESNYFAVSTPVCSVVAGVSRSRGPFFQTKLPLEIEYRYTIDRRRKKQRRKSYAVKAIGPYRVPEFRVELASYQQEAVAWMLAREQSPKKHQQHTPPNPKPNRYPRLTEKVCGGILADEMGLGKTVCCIGLICESLKQMREECQRETESSGSSIPRIKPPTLIITPLSILSQWENEIREKTNLSVITYHGSTRKSYRTAMEFMGADIVLSTYDTLRLKECKVGPSTHTNDEDEDSRGPIGDPHNGWRTVLRNVDEDKRSSVGSKLHQLSWFRIILDESHLITNASCARARTAYSLQSKRRWCVTGTPIQNSSSDLASLATFVGIKHKSEAELNEMLPHIMLRRLKTTVDSESNEPILALPEKREEEVELRFANELEEAFYMLLHRSTRKQVMQYLQARDAQPQFMHVFELLLRLRQTCNSFALVTQDPVTEVRGNGTLLRADAGAALTQVVRTGLLERVEAQFADQRALPQSTKLCALLSHLRAVKGKNEKALVISQWTGFLDLIVESLENENAGGGPLITFGKLDGRMAAREREQVIAWFQHDKRLDVLLISLRTGGLGLNLTAASHVFIMEPSWNPSIESQAIDRAHRFGQSRPVRVVRFIMKNTIEERVVELQRKKRALAATLLGDPSAPNASSSPSSTEEPRLTRAELRQLFTQEQSDE